MLWLAKSGMNKMSPTAFRHLDSIHKYSVIFVDGRFS